MLRPVDRSMTVSPPQRIAHTIFSTSSSTEEVTAELPMLALIFTRKLRPMIIGSSPPRLMLAGGGGGAGGGGSGGAGAGGGGAGGEGRRSSRRRRAPPWRRPAPPCGPGSRG